MSFLIENLLQSFFSLALNRDDYLSLFRHSSIIIVIIFFSDTPTICF